MNIIESFEYAKEQLRRMQVSFSETDRLISEMQCSLSESVESFESELIDKDTKARLFSDMKFYELNVPEDIREQLKSESYTLEEYVDALQEYYCGLD